jgi:hypothetical protein
MWWYTGVPVGTELSEWIGDGEEERPEGGNAFEEAPPTAAD